MRLLTIMAVFAGMLLSAARAPAQSPSAETLAAARDLVVTMKATDQFNAIFPILMQSLKPAIVQDRPAVEKDFDAILPVIIESLRSRTTEMVDLMAAIYAQNFNVAELRDIAAFYRTPTGQEMLANLPAITQQSVVAGQKMAQSMLGDLQQRMIEELRKRGHSI